MLLLRFKALAVDGSEPAAAGGERKDGAQRRGVDRSAARTGSRSLRSTPGAARIHQKTAGAEARKAQRMTGCTMTSARNAGAQCRPELVCDAPTWAR